VSGVRQSKAKRVKELANAAEAEFFSKAYDEVSMETIAARAGMTRSTARGYFSSKDELLMAVHERVYEPLHAMAMLAREAKNPLEGMKRLIGDTFRFWAGHQKELALHYFAMSKIIGRDSLGVEMNSYEAVMTTTFYLLLEAAVEKGQLAKHNELSRATVLFCAVEGALPYAAKSHVLTRQKIASRIARELLGTMSEGETRNAKLESKSGAETDYEN
jgi:AcrR family transcriptional regulator